MLHKDDHLIEGLLARVRTRIRSLRALEQQLTALRNCCATPQTAAECGILHELVTAARHEAVTDNPPGRSSGVGRVGDL